jgi:iron(III) transport system substrate-binding protein
VKISSSNGESADLVASGEFDFSLVDSDDAVNRSRQGKPVRIIYPDQGESGDGMLILPNAAVLIRSAPHAEQAKKLVDYLLSRETERKLAFADCAQIPLHPGVETPPDVPKLETVKTMRIDYAAAARKLKDIQPLLTKWAGY